MTFCLIFCIRQLYYNIPRIKSIFAIPYQLQSSAISRDDLIIEFRKKRVKAEISKFRNQLSLKNDLRPPPTPLKIIDTDHLELEYNWMNHIDEEISEI